MPDYTGNTLCKYTVADYRVRYYYSRLVVQRLAWFRVASGLGCRIYFLGFSLERLRGVRSILLDGRQMFKVQGCRSRFGVTLNPKP